MAEVKIGVNTLREAVFFRIKDLDVEVEKDKKKGINWGDSAIRRDELVNMMLFTIEVLERKEVGDEAGIEAMRREIYGNK